MKNSLEKQKLNPTDLFVVGLICQRKLANRFEDPTKSGEIGALARPQTTQNNTANRAKALINYRQREISFSEGQTECFVSFTFLGSKDF